MPEIKIVINKHGYCSDECQFFGSHSRVVFCEIGVHRVDQDNATSPGVGCPGPGTYRLVKIEEDTDVTA